MDSLLDFSQQTALITGAGSGFGKLLAQGLASRGCNLVISDLNQEWLNATVESLSQYSVGVVSRHNDVALESSAIDMVQTALAEFGKLDMAINNAGIAHLPGPLHLIKESVLQKQIDVNVKGVMFGMKAQIDAMLKQPQGGHILNVASMAGVGGAPKAGAYAAAKHAVVGLTRTAAVEYGRKGIRVNAICPFFSPTKIMDVEGLNDEQSRAMLAQGCPLKRLAEPQEVVNAMILMLSPGNTFMNGQELRIDGGVSAW